MSIRVIMSTITTTTMMTVTVMVTTIVTAMIIKMTAAMISPAVKSQPTAGHSMSSLVVLSRSSERTILMEMAALTCVSSPGYLTATADPQIVGP